MSQYCFSEAMLQRRATLLRALREFFFKRNVTEVDVPCLGLTTVTDPHIQSFKTAEFFLQTSPEYYMKRLLANNSGDIYYLGKAFRSEEIGRLHSPEFTMLEWYRQGYDDQSLIDEIFFLIRSLGGNAIPVKTSYQHAFEKAVGVNPHSSSVEELRSIAHQKLHVDWGDEDKNIWLDLLFTHLVEPSLKESLVAVYDYPESQCALARLGKSDCGNYTVARRFEIYWNSIELANGYHELTDSVEQRRRLVDDNQQRKVMGLSEVAIDEQLLGALDKGLPDCAGVALGVDRLLMCLEKENDIGRVMPFSLSQ